MDASSKDVEGQNNEMIDWSTEENIHVNVSVTDLLYWGISKQAH